MWAKNVQTHSRDNKRLWCEWAEKSIIYGVDQYVSVDLIETKTVAPHKYFAPTKLYVWEKRQMMQQDLYIFSRRDYGTYPFLK